MTTPSVRDLCHTVSELAEAVYSERGDETWDRWLATMSRFHLSYSPNNCALIMQQRPQATRVAGFQVWAGLGAFPRRGTKAIRLLAPMFRRSGRLDQTTGQDEMVEECRGYRTVCVFDISDLVNPPQLPSYKPDLGEGTRAILDAAVAFMRGNGIHVQFRPLLGSLNGYSAGGEVVINAALPPGVQVQVACHEAGHELLHKSEQRQRWPHAFIEGEAESCAVVVMRALGYDTVSNGSRYIREHGGNRDTVTASLSRICSAARTILTGIQTNLPPDVRATLGASLRMGTGGAA